MMWKIILVLSPFLASIASATPSHARSACNCGKVFYGKNVMNCERTATLIKKN